MDSDNKGLVLFDILDMSQSFQDKLKQTREQFGVPKNGFVSRKKADRWLSDIEREWNRDMFKKENPGYKKLQAYRVVKNEIANEFKIPPVFFKVIDEKIACSKKIFSTSFLPRFGCTLVEAEDREGIFDPIDAWKNSELPSATLLIHHGVSKRDVKKYIDLNWDQIEGIIGKAKRIKQRPNNGRDEIVFYVCGMTNAELGVQKGMIRETAIKKFLENKYSIHNLTEKNIERICTEQRRLRK